MLIFWTVPAKAADTAPPAFTATPTPYFALGSWDPGAASFLLTADWAATDRSGVASYETQVYNTGTRRYEHYDWFETPTSMRVWAAAPGSYKALRIQATDAKGNTSDWAYGEPYAVDLLQEKASAVKVKGAWTRPADSTASGGHVLSCATSGATLTFTGTMRGFALIAPLVPGYGSAIISIDGGAGRNLKFASPDGQTYKQDLMFQAHWATRGKHVVKITLSGNRRVDVDAFGVIS